MRPYLRWDMVSGRIAMRLDQIKDMYIALARARRPVTERGSFLTHPLHPAQPPFRDEQTDAHRAPEQRALRNAEKLPASLGARERA